MRGEMWSRKLQPGEAAARELLWAKYRAGKKGNDFNRPLNTSPLDVV
jgi:hypothetical protein